MLPEEERAWDEFLAHEARGVALRADFWRPVLAVWQVVRHPRRSPRRVVAVLAVVVMIAGMTCLAIHAPSQGCRRVTAYVTSLPCTCKPGPEDGPCGRCAALGQWEREPVGR